MIAALDENGLKSSVFYDTEISTIYGPVDSCEVTSCLGSLLSVIAFSSEL